MNQRKKERTGVQYCQAQGLIFHTQSHLIGVAHVIIMSVPVPIGLLDVGLIWVRIRFGSRGTGLGTWASQSYNFDILYMRLFSLTQLQS